MTDDTLPDPDRIPGAPHPRETAHLFGQSRAEAEFLEAYRSGRLHSGWLISGPQGVGKATLAYRIARFLLRQTARDLGLPRVQQGAGLVDAGAATAVYPKFAGRLR